MSENVQTIRVVIIEDQRRIRESLAMLIGGTEGYACVGAFRSVEEALARPWAEAAEVALIDIGLPGVSGIEGIRRIRSQYPDTIPVVLTVYGDDDRIFEALCAGACGYLLKKTTPAKLLEYIREVMSGGAPVSPEVVRRMIELFRSVMPPERAAYHLTPSETRLLKLLVEGHNYKTASAVMDVSFNTVSFHMKNIYQKLQVHSKSEAVAKALRMNFFRR